MGLINMILKKIVNIYFVKRTLNYLLGFLSKEKRIRLQHRVLVKRKLNLSNPKRFTDKLQWYKLNYYNPQMIQCVDKYRVREYIKDKGYEDILVDLYQVCESYEEIDFDKLPNSFVIKSNKGSGTNIFVRNKNEIDYDLIKNEINKWDIVNTIVYGNEWPYEGVKHKIVIEELLIDNKNPFKDINDYKFLCFNGKVKYIWVDIERSTNHKRNFYDTNWNKLNVESDVPTTEQDIEKPKKLDYMIEIAESIGKDFPFARVDLYWVNEKVYFGEITFYPWSGCVRFTPDSFDFELGKCFKLPLQQNKGY